MFTHTKFAYLAILVAVIGAQAQDAPPPLPTGVSQCIITCLYGASDTAGCPSEDDWACNCNNAEYQQAYHACLQTVCTSDDLTAGENYYQQECANVSGTGSGSVVTAPTGPASGTAVSASSASSAASAATSAVSSASLTASSASATGSSASVAGSSASVAGNSASKAGSSASVAGSGASKAGNSAGGSGSAPTGGASHSGNAAFSVAPLNVNGLAGLGAAVVAAVAGAGFVL